MTKHKTIAMVAALTLLALPLAAQVPESGQPEPQSVEESAEQLEQAAEREAAELAQEAEETGREIEQEVDEALETQEPSTTTAAPDSGDELPRTASPLAALALLGLAGAGSALGLRVARRK
jgi:hypothetical protein